MSGTMKIGFFFLLVVIPLSAYGGPPLLTNDPGTPGPGKWENNFALIVDHRSGQTKYDAPDLDLNYGIGDRTQLTYEIPFVVLQEQGGGTKGGLGNSAVGLKRRFLDEDRHGISVSVFPQFEFNNPTSSADRGLVEEGTTFFLPFQAGKKLGGFGVVSELGYAFRHGGDDHWIYGLAAGRAIRKGIEVLAEVHGETRRILGRHETVVNMGATWDITEKRSLLFSLGRSLHTSPEEPSLLLYLGMQLRS